MAKEKKVKVEEYEEEVEVKKSKWATLSKVCLILAVLIAVVACFSSFATPVVSIGGETHKGETLGLLAFIKEVNTGLSDNAKTLSNSITGSAADQAEINKMVAAATSALRHLVFLWVPAVVVLVAQIVHVLAFLISLSAKGTERLRKTAVKSALCVLIAPVYFAFFGTLSIGAGEDAAVNGYTLGGGALAGIVIGCLLILAAAAFGAIDNRQNFKQNLPDYLRAGVFALGGAVIVVILTKTSFYEIVTDLIQTLLGGGGKIVPFVLLLSVLFFFLYHRAKAAAVCGLRGALSLGDTAPDERAQKRAKERNVKWNSSMIVSAIAALAAVLVILYLRRISSVNLPVYGKFVAIFAVAAVTQALLFFFRKPKAAAVTAGETPAEQAEAPTEEAEVPAEEAETPAEEEKPAE